MSDRPRLIVFTGLPGTGKSTLADEHTSGPPFLTDARAILTAAERGDPFPLSS